MSFVVDEKIFEGKVELPSKAFTHGAKFHSDDVFATALLNYQTIYLTKNFLLF